MRIARVSAFFADADIKGCFMGRHSEDLQINEITRIHNEIEPILLKRSSDWHKLQQKVLTRLREYEGDSSLSPSIYRIYTREERQTYLGIVHPHMKQFFKIAEEVFLAQSGTPKVRSGKDRRPSKKKPSFDLYDVTDIIGISVVCPSEEDVERIRRKIEEDINEGKFTRKKTKTLDGTLYRACHIVVGIDEDPLEQLCCEIQLKTAIQDAFSWKTHGLAYKPVGKIIGENVAQFSSVIAVLRAADLILESITKKLRDDNEVNHEKRRYARYLLSEKLALDLDKMRDNENYLIYNDAIKELRDQLALPTTARNGRKIHEIKKFIDDLVDEHDEIVSLNKFYFRLIALCSIVNPRRDASYWLDRIFNRYLTSINALYKRKKNYKETLWYNGLDFSLAYYCRGELKSACGVLEQILRAAKGVSKRVTAYFHCEAAYFYAEQYSQSPSSQLRDSALSHFTQSWVAYDGEVPARNLDSLGYVLIQTGEDMETIQRGLDMCGSAIKQLLQESSADVQTVKAGKFFLKLHTEIAYKRMWELASGDCDSAIASAPPFRIGEKHVA